MSVADEKMKPAPGRLRRRTVAALTVLALLGASALGVVMATSASAVTKLLINSLGLEAATGSLTDGVCQSTSGKCTLRAAIQESNAMNGAAGDIEIGVDTSLAGGNINLSTSNSTWMRTTYLYTAQGAAAGSVGGDTGAVFEVTSPVVIDLGHKITIHEAPSSNDPNVAVFYLNGPDITLRGMDDVYFGETSFYVGPQASNILLTDMSISTVNYYPERFILVRGGAQNVTVSHSTIKGYASNDRDWNWGVVDGTSSAYPVKGLTINNVTYIGGSSGYCDSSTAVGCTSTAVDAYGQYLTELTFTNNTMTNINRAYSYNARALDLRGATITMLLADGNTFDAPYYRYGDPVIDLYTAVVGTFKITGNVFKNMDGNGDLEIGAAAVLLPAARNFTSGLVARNSFVATGTLSTQAVYYQGTSTSDSATNMFDTHLSITDNYFDGFSTSNSHSSIRLWSTGVVEVARNTFGPRSNTQTNTVLEEYGGNGAYDATMLSNWSRASNGKMNTWFPTARNKSNAQAAPVNAVGCTVPLQVAPPTDADANAYASARYPAVTPLSAQLDVYWTADRTAEVYLGRYAVSANVRTTLQIPLPTSASDPALATNGGVGPVNPATGVVSGGLRVQTIDPNATGGGTPASSQYSRVATIGGTCAPVVTIAQRTDQLESSMARDRVFRLTSSLALDEATVTAGIFGLTGSTASGAQVVKVVKIDDKTWDVTVHAADSGVITVNVAAGAVKSTGGFASTEAATFGSTTATDNKLTYVNPLRVTPAKFALVTGEPHGKSYSLSVDSAAPVPAADLKFTSTLDGAAQTYQVTPETLNPTIAAGGTSVSVNVTAPKGDVAADTITVISHTVASDDPNYDGLVVPSVSPHLFATDPALQIKKLAYIDVTDDSSPESIQNTGTAVASGSRLTDRTPVWFVFKVTNTSADDWATTLTDIKVTDDVLGDIGTIPSLVSGASTLLAYQGPFAVAANAPLPEGSGTP